MNERILTNLEDKHIMYQETNLTDDQILTLAPSVFATEPKEDVSSKYEFIPTSRVLGCCAQKVGVFQEQKRKERIWILMQDSKIICSDSVEMI